MVAGRVMLQICIHSNERWRWKELLVIRRVICRNRCGYVSLGGSGSGVVDVEVMR